MEKSNNQATFLQRLNQLRNQLETAEIDAFFLHTEPSIRYYTGFTGDSSYLLVESKQTTFFTDGRYVTQAASELPSTIEILLITSFTDLARQLGRHSITKLGIEEQSFSVAKSSQLQREITGLEIVFCQQQITSPRQFKNPNELETIRRAIKIAEDAYQATIPLLRPGITENEIALELEYQMKRRGAEQAAFSLIVASGYRSSLPHGLATNKPIAPDDPVTIDFGARFQGYHSDQTCTLFLGEPSKKQQEVYQTVYQAQQAGIKAVTNGMAAKELDQIVRRMINQAGYGDFFSHGTGHGVGLEIHETPSISTFSNQQLETGMVFTIEPGCYFPHQWGIRLEDMVHLAQEATCKLTTLDKRLENAIIS